MRFKVLLQNIRSIQKKLWWAWNSFTSSWYKASHYCSDWNLDIQKILKGSLQLTGYSNLITCDRESRGGGVVFFVSNEPSIRIIQITTKKLQQILTVEIESGESKCLVSVLYKAPVYSTDNFTDDLIEHFEKTKSDVDTRILCDDFNTDVKKLNKNSIKLK